MDNDGWMDAAPFKDELPEGWYEESEEEKAAADTAAAPESDVIGRCPCFGFDVVDRQKAYFCSNYDCNFALWKNNKFFQAISKEMTRDIAKELMDNGGVRLQGCKSVKTGNSFNCIVRMDTDAEDRAQFRIEFPRKKKKTEDEYYGRA
jgi:DNA topoisomerase-3